MSNNLVSAYIMTLKQQSRPMTIERFQEDIPAINIEATISSYKRNLATIEEMTITGYEFVIYASQLNGTSYDPPKKGDILSDPKFGELSISEVEPQVILGEIAGYRVRTS